MNKRSLPDRWSLKKIGEIATVVSGGTPSRNQPKYWVNGNIPWVTPTDITRDNSQTLSEAKEKITELGLRSSSANLLPIGTLLMTSRATVGEIKISTVPVSTNQGFKNLIPNALVDKWYLYYQMVYHKESYKQLGNGSTFLEVSKSATESFEICYAPLPEQRAIADVLLTVDEAIAQSESLVRKYQSIKQGLMSDLLTRGVDENGELRPSYEEAPNLYQDTSLGRLPKEWEIKKVDDAFNLILGKMLSKVSKKGKSPFPYLANRNVQWDKLDLSDLDWMDFSDAEREKLELLQEDLLVCEGGEVGRTAIWNNEMKECYFQKAIHRLRSKDRSVLPRFMLRYMRFAAQSGLFTNFTSQTSISHLTQEKLKTLPLIRPKVPEQERIIKIFDNQDELASQEDAMLKKLQLLKQGLMQDLLSGQVRVKVKK